MMLCGFSSLVISDLQLKVKGLEVAEERSSRQTMKDPNIYLNSLGNFVMTTSVGCALHECMT